MNILVIATHADDEVLGVGGTIALHKERGDNVTVCTVTEGDADLFPKERLDLKREQTLAAHNLLGVDNSLFLGFSATKLDTYPLRNIISELNHVFQKVQPSIIYTHYWGDVNKEHRIVNQAIQVIIRPLSHRKTLNRHNANLSYDITKAKVYSYEVLSSTEWGMYLSDYAFKPNTFVDIEKTIDIKCNALKEYKTELMDYPDPRSVDGIKASAQKWGMASGMRFAEPFILVRENIF